MNVTIALKFVEARVVVQGVQEILITD